MLTSDEILAVLEEQMAELADFSGATFELLEDYRAIGDARLTVFRSDDLWALTIEVVAYDRAEEFNLEVYLYGNCIKPRESLSNLTRPIFVIPSVWNQVEGNYKRDKFSLRWRGKRYDFAPTLEDLQSAGVQLSKREQESGELTPQQVLRYVCHALEHPFFASEDCLRDLLDQNRFDVEMKYAREEENYRSWAETPLGELEEYPVLSCDLELLLQTRDWRHPRFGGIEDNISIRDAFEDLAKALAAKDLAQWHAQDFSKFNSHWRFWAETEFAQEQVTHENLDALKLEAERFQAYLEKLPSDHREKFIRDLKTRWGRQKREIVELLGATKGEASFIHQGTIEVDGEVFTFGPHLWGEEPISLVYALGYTGIVDLPDSEKDK